MSFRIGRKFASHTYPETPRAAPAAFARNSADWISGQDPLPPPLPIPIINMGLPGVVIPWTFVEIGATGAAVQITPRVTKIVRLIAMVVVQNLEDGSRTILVQAVIGGALSVIPVAFATVDTAAENLGFETLTFMWDVTLPTALNVPTSVGIALTADADDSLQLLNATLDVQELPPPTG